MSEDRAYDASQVENVHHGAIAVVALEDSGRRPLRVTHWAGDPQWSTFTRSTLKPFQALDFVRAGGHLAYGWTTREVALMCASHSGEDMHTAIVDGMLASAGWSAGDLQCGCHVPGWYAALDRTPPPGAAWTPVQHNCSGKHSGFLASCRFHGESAAAYLAPDAPLQRRIADAVGALAGVPTHRMPTGTDGCSAPNYALPLATLAGLYAQLAQGRDSPAEPAALETLRTAMTAHPELVSGTARSDLALMGLAPGDWVTKIGADGVQAIGIRSAGIGIAVKIADGNRDALYVAVVETLFQLGLLPERSEAGEARFAPWLRRRIRNVRGQATGRILPAFTIRVARSDASPERPPPPPPFGRTSR